jgi:hypothetical protein
MQQVAFKEQVSKNDSIGRQVSLAPGSSMLSSNVFQRPEIPSLSKSSGK